MGGSEGRRWTGVVLIAVGLLAVVGSLAGGVWAMGGVEGGSYSHTLTDEGDHRCSTTGPAAEQYRYGELSSAGQDVVDRAIADPGSPVVTGDPVPAFEYGTPIDPAGPQYVRAHGNCYRLEAEQSGMGNPGPAVQVGAFAALGILAVLGTAAAAVGTVKVGRDD